LKPYLISITKYVIDMPFIRA